MSIRERAWAAFKSGVYKVPVAVKTGLFSVSTALVAASLTLAILVIYTSADPARADRLLTTLKSQKTLPPDLIAATLCTAVIVGLVEGIAVGLMTRLRLREFERALRQVAEGNFKAALPPPPGPDFRFVESAFTKMTSAIDELTSRLKHADAQRRRLFSDLAHELATPTASIVAVADFLIEDQHKSEQTRTRMLQALDEESRRLERLIRDIRDLANLDDPDVKFAFENADLTHLVKRFTDRANTTSTQTRVTADLADVRAEVDPIRIEQVLVNVVANARRYAPADGEVRLRLTDENDHVLLCIDDSGKGVTDEVLPRLGERLLRVDPSRARTTGGAGLGLSIVAAIVHRHGGSVGFEHSDLGGLSVQVRLPKERGAAVTQLQPPTAE